MAFYGWRFDPLVSTKNVFTLFIIINLSNDDYEFCI